MLSEKKQKRMILIGWLVLIPLAFTIALTLIQRVTAKKGSFTASDVSGEYFTVDTDGTAKTDEFSLYTGGGMPCENPEQFERWYATYEQTESEEELSVESEGSDLSEGEHEDGSEELYSSDETEMETDAETAEDTPSDEILLDSLFQIDGRVLRPELQTYLRHRLSEQGIEWFMPYAIMIAYQESHFDIYAVNPYNKIDCGLFQFRSVYYTGSDIFDPYEQIDIFCELMGNRARMGCDVYEMISRHMQSDYGSYNNEYVTTVLSHEKNLREVKQ